jgi:hypothetical protein
LVELTQYLCKCLAAREQYFPLCELIAILNENEPTYKADQNIMVETFLRVLTEYETLQKKDIESCRRIVDYYLTYYCDVSIITDMYADKFIDIQME